MRGSGKSSVARSLSALTGRASADTDDLIERATGRTVSDIFARDGEPRFRDLERSAVADAAAHPGWIVSVGGGAVLHTDNRRLLKTVGPCVWLHAAPEFLWDRIRTDAASPGRRPALTALQGLDELRELLHVREPVYRDFADFTVDTAGRSVDDVAMIVLQAWQSWPRSAPA
ncbi:MAG: Shikimate kinase 2 [Phycisphaerae bacterium]|nr:Shikimate kinase 2 [Phycisphaerae bacterium]